MNNLKKYSIILADPPWQYRDKCNDGKRGACHKYEVLSLSDLKNLNVKSIAYDNCAIFLWSTAPMMPNALDLINAWGFCYKTIAFTWVKKNKVSDSLFWGMGHHTRANAEYCLLGMRGRLERKSAKVHSIIESKIRAHSQKPDEIYERIIELYGKLPSVELFARKSNRYFHSFGDEIDGKDLREVLK